MQQQRTLTRSQETDETASSSSGRTETFLEGIVGAYVPTEDLSCPHTVTHVGETWHVIKVGENSWTFQVPLSDFFDTFKGDGGAQGGALVVRCRLCAIDGHTATYVLRGGK